MRALIPSIAVCLLAAGAPAQVAWNMEGVENLGGRSNVVARFGDRVFLAAGGNVLMYDTASPTSPGLLDERALHGTATGLDADDTYLYATVRVEGRLAPTVAILGYTEDDRLRPEGELLFEEYAYGADVAIDGNLMYLSGTAGITVVDVTDRTAPVILGNEADAAYSGRMAYAAGYAYSVSGSNALFITDVSSPAAPDLKSIVNLAPGDLITDVAVSGNIAFATLYTGRMAVVNVADRTNPQVLSTIGTGGAFAPRIEGTRLYMPSGYRQMSVYSIASPASPAHLATFDLGFDVQDFAIGAGYGWFAAGVAGLRSVDMANLAAPTVTVAERLPLPQVDGMAFAGDTIVAACGYDGFSVLAGTGADYEESANLPTAEYAERVATRGTTAFVFGFGDRIPLFDVADPLAPAAAGEIVGEAGFAHRGAVRGDLLAVAGTNDRVSIFNLAGPAPAPAGSFALPAGSTVHQVRIGESGLVYACTSQGLYAIVPLAVPALAFHHPRQRGDAFDFLEDGNRGFLACGGGGLQLLDIAGPAPAILDHLANPSSALEFDGSGNIYSSSGTYEGYIHRISAAGDRFEQIGLYQAPQPPGAIAANAAGLWIPAGIEGLHLAAPFADPFPNRPPRRPRTLSPAIGATGVTLAPTLDFTPFSDPDDAGSPNGQNGGAYVLVVDADGAGVTAGYTQDGTFAVDPPLAPNTPYWWFALQNDNSGDTATGSALRTEWGSFTTGNGTVEPNDPPTANAGTPQTVAPGQAVSLDASGSSDPDADTLSFAWSQTGGTVVALENRFAAIASFSAPAVATPSVLTFDVIVGDGRVNRVASTTVTVDPGNNPPVPPIITSPADGASIPDTALIVVSAFSDVDLADTHAATRLQFAADADPSFASPLATETIPGSSTQFPIPAPLAPGQYRLRAAQQDSRGIFSDYGPAVRFTLRAYVPSETWEVQ